MALLEKEGVVDRLVRLSPRPATGDELVQVHTREYISMIEAAARRGGGWLDADTIMSTRSYEAALYAAGGLTVAVEAVMGGEPKAPSP